MSCPDLRADCARCAALCCVAFAFDRSRLFAFDKAGGEPCRHLSAHGTCRIHGDRASHGMAGCIAYDCLGAGQRVTQALFRGRTWAEEPALRAPMAEAFLTVVRAHRLLELLVAAKGLSLAHEQQVRRDDLEAAIVAAGAEAAAVSRLEGETYAFLRGLRPRLEDQAV